jgi:cytochrome c oxidase subunit IV
VVTVVTVFNHQLLEQLLIAQAVAVAVVSVLVLLVAMVVLAAAVPVKLQETQHHIP